MSSIDLALAFLSGAAVKRANKPGTGVAVKAENGKIKRAATREEKAKPAPFAPPPVRKVTPETAQAFLETLRVAGKRRNDRGIFVHGGPIPTREDQSDAIHAMTGRYDVGVPHGAQLDAATALAQRTLRPADTSLGKVRPTVAGYVAGAVDSLGKARANFLARERLSVAALDALRHVENGAQLAACLDDETESAEARKMSPEGAVKHAAALGILERGRLNEIRADLARL